MARRKNRKNVRRQSQMTPFERWTLYLAAVGVVISVVLQLPDLYFRYLYSVRSLVVVPLDLKLTYETDGVKYDSSMTFINNGKEDVVLRGFRLRIRAPDLGREGTDTIDSQELPWEVSSFVLRANEEATYSYASAIQWQAGFLRCSRAAPKLSRAMARATLHFSFDASTLNENSTIRQHVDINVAHRGRGHLVGGSQSPHVENFEALDRRERLKKPKPPIGVDVTTVPPC